ncbi:uncharacterized protein [Rutidosis leptorrhynchoides]|uniref:uncharacterized protein n=1 Tax=Rutidosis leptorrhynchoides TaxID=125765 RepID=UPI003A9A4E18
MDMLSGVKLNPQARDLWKWKAGGSEIFSTKGLTNLINSKLLIPSDDSCETLCTKLVTEKIEVFVWRANKKRLPVLVELDKRGIVLHSVRCPLCDDGIKTVNHSHILCKRAFDVWCKVFDWWGRGGILFVNVEDMFTDAGQTNPYVDKSIWQAVIWSTSYLIWKNRNQNVFSNKSWNTPMALNEIQIKSYEWVVKRCKAKSLDWHIWLHNGKVVGLAYMAPQPSSLPLLKSGCHLSIMV